MAVLNATGRTSIDPADLPAFEKPPKTEMLKGPMIIHRFGDTRGRWWYAATLLGEMREDYIDATVNNARLQSSELTMHVRFGLAVSREWNRFQWISRIDLDSTDELQAWVGTTAPQPEWQSQPDGRILHGGLIQYLIYDLAKAPTRIFSRQSLVSVCRTWAKSVQGVRVK